MPTLFSYKFIKNFKKKSKKGFTNVEIKVLRKGIWGYCPYTNTELYIAEGSEYGGGCGYCSPSKHIFNVPKKWLEE